MFIQYKYILDVDFCQEKMFSFGKLLLDYKYYYFLFNYIDNKRLKVISMIPVETIKKDDVTPIGGN